MSFALSEVTVVTTHVKFELYSLSINVCLRFQICFFVAWTLASFVIASFSKLVNLIQAVILIDIDILAD